MKAKYNFWNPLKRKYGYVEYCGDFFAAIKDGKPTTYLDLAGAVMDLKNSGYEPNGFIDEMGCRRYTMTLPELQGLYKKMESFVADCTQQEYNENKSDIIAVYTLIKKHIDAEIKK